MTFATPQILAVLPLLAVAIALGLATRSRRSGPALIVADAGPLLAARRPTWRVRLRWMPVALRWLAILLLVVAIARPRQGLALTSIPEEGIDIVVTVDVSSSMLTPLGGGTTRIAAARQVVTEFVSSLEGDRVGLVIFQARALTLSPLTLDQAAIRQRVSTLAPGLLEDGTAIGLGLSEALNLLRDSSAVSRVIVLLTDGENNAGEVDPLTAARLAKALGIRLYAIGFVGGSALGSVDARTLQAMAESTGGRYFDARTQNELAAAYREIGDLERSLVAKREFTTFRELAPPLIAVALALLVIEQTLRATWLRRHP